MKTVLWIISFISMFAVLAFLLHNLAKQNILVTYIKNNTVKYVTRGGLITRLIWARQGEYQVYDAQLERHRWEPGIPGKMYTSEFIGPLDTILWYFFKMRIIGLPPFFSIDKWKYTWDSYKPGHKDADKNGIVRHSEEIVEDYIVAYYAFEFKNVEIQGNFKITQWMSLTVEMQDMMIAHTMIQPKGDWLRKFWISAQTRVLEFCAQKDQDQIRTSNYSGKETEFWNFFLKSDAPTNINEELSLITGVEVIDIDWIGFESEELEAQAEALKAKETMRLKKEAAIEGEKLNVELEKLKTESFKEGSFAQDELRAELLEKNPKLVELKKVEALHGSGILSIGGNGLGIILNQNPEQTEKPEKEETEKKKGGK